MTVNNLGGPAAPAPISGVKLRNGRWMGNYEAYDRLPKAARLMLQNATHNWSAASVYRLLRRKNPATGKRWTVAEIALGMAAKEGELTVALCNEMGWNPEEYIG